MRQYQASGSNARTTKNQRIVTPGAHEKIRILTKPIRIFQRHYTSKNESIPMAMLKVNQTTMEAKYIFTR